MRSLGFLALAVFIFSCNSKVPSNSAVLKSNDTFALAYASKGQNNWVLVQGAYSIGDTVWKREGAYSLDTAWKFYIFRDTLRDSKMKPIYDTALHQYKSRFEWVQLTPTDKQGIDIVILRKINK